MNFTYNNQKEFETGIPDNLEFSNDMDHRNFSDDDDGYAQSEMVGQRRNQGQLEDYTYYDDDITQQIYQLEHQDSEIPMSKASSKVFYSLTLKIHFETKFGEYLAVTGNIKELGNWKEFTCKLIWTEGHIWQTPTAINTDLPFFQYKYVVLHKDDEPKYWESGLNRIADVQRLSTMKRQAGLQDILTLELLDKWNKFCVKFNMVYPIDHYGGEVFVQGLKPDLNLKMEQAKQPRTYIEHKYGKQMTPFTASFDFQVDELKFEKDENGCKFFFCKYNYAVKNRELSIDKVERNAEFRSFRILDP